MATLEARPRSIFSWNFDLLCEGQPIVTMNVAWLREGGSFSWEGTSYGLRREGRWSGDFVLEADGRDFARATKPSAFLRRFDIQLPDRALLFTAASPFTRIRIARERHSHWPYQAQPPLHSKMYD